MQTSMRRDDSRSDGPEIEMTNRNVLYLVLGALIVACAVLGYKVYQDNHQPKGLQINVGPDGLKIDSK